MKFDVVIAEIVKLELGLLMGKVILVRIVAAFAESAFSLIPRISIFAKKGAFFKGTLELAERLQG